MCEYVYALWYLYGLQYECMHAAHRLTTAPLPVCICKESADGLLDFWTIKHRF